MLAGWAHMRRFFMQRKAGAAVVVTYWPPWQVVLTGVVVGVVAVAAGLQVVQGQAALTVAAQAEV